MSRLLTTLLLYRCGYVVGRYISLESKIEKTKERYYEVLNLCGEGWHEGSNDPTPFVKYLLGIILAAYRDFEDRVDLFDEKLPAIELVRRAVSQKLGKFTKSEIMELVPAVSFWVAWCCKSADGWSLRRSGRLWLNPPLL